MAKIKKISIETKLAIQRKSAYSLPNNPTESGYKAYDIRKAFYKPIIDDSNSAISEIDRVIDEVNTAFDEIEDKTTECDNHINNKKNPHNVTKSDVGLSRVVNAGMDETPTENSDNYVKSGGAKKYVDDELTPVIDNIIDLKSRWQTTNGRIASHTSNKNNPHEVTKEQVGLGNVDNTSDENKPVSTAQQTEFNKKLDKTGGAINGNLSISGDLVVNGTEKVNNVENLNVKDQMIYANSEGAALAGNAGLGIKKDKTNIYGIVYDEADDAVKLGLGTADKDGKFTFNDGEGSAVAAREDSSAFANNHLVKWDANKKKLVDSGKTVDDLVQDMGQQVAAAKQAAKTAQNEIGLHEADKVNPHGVTKLQVGLGNVDNTADKDKPVSAAQKAAIDEKLDKPTNAGTAGQVLTKTASGSEWKDADGGDVAADGDNNFSGTNTFKKPIIVKNGTGLNQTEFGDGYVRVRSASLTTKKYLFPPGSGADVNIATEDDTPIIIKKTIDTMPSPTATTQSVSFTTDEQNKIKASFERVILVINTEVLYPKSGSSILWEFASGITNDAYYTLSLTSGIGMFVYNTMTVPVGNIYLSTSSTSPAGTFGGTWERIKDKFLLAAGDTYSAGVTGGSADAVVVSHTHTTSETGTGSGGVAADGSTFQRGYSGTYKKIASTNYISINSTGVSGTGKNMPPYLVVYVWKRVS